jgi:TetR/AcrR family transcriptional repressor of lmrAB and yxaGH operons
MMNIIETNYEGRHSQMNRRNVRQEMVNGAISLLAEKGVQGTSFAVVTEATKTPRGSIYHHFPGGKNELIEEALTSIGTLVTSLIDAVEVDSPSKVVDVFVESWRALLLANNFAGNCAVANASLGAGDQDSLKASANEVFKNWQHALARAFERSGAKRKDAVDFAAVCLASVEGALILGRASESDEVFKALSRQLKKIVC